MADRLEARGLSKAYPIRGGVFLKSSGSVKAVNGVDLDLVRGRVLGLVGESGCGKSTLARLLLLLEQADRGQITWGVADLCRPNRDFRRRVQAVFQDPYGTLDPRFTILQSLEEGLINLFPDCDRTERRRRIAQALSAVGLPESVLERFPHEFSGGQRQRIGIARTLVVEPEFLICDEPVSSLDVSVAAQIITLLKRLTRERRLGLLLISHHMGIVSALADEVAVMKEGSIIERGPVREVLLAPRADYTRRLMAAVPRLEINKCP